MPYFRRRMVWEIVNHKLLWCQSKDIELVELTQCWVRLMDELHVTNSGHVLGSTCTPAHQIRNQLFYSASPKSSSDGTDPQHCLLSSSPLWFLFLVPPWSVSLEVETLCVFCRPAKTDFQITLTLKNHTLSCNFQFGANMKKFTCCFITGRCANYAAEFIHGQVY